ncbi:hypothetical protein [Methanobrevibacter sp.]|uniref:hypothetical protein n=1 Tax=Methanobrevibacter sp. TaxID=66852 RepID=UPI0025EB3AB0|nr:hypothetical protein [Methanobrevibacter sp.]MBQ2832843.1 hypothetical protein [Methanobrevibacter sp.]
MDKEIKKIFDYIFNFNTTNEYLFHKLYGFTFVFRRDITTLNDKVTSAEILPVGIIYEENDEFCYAPLYGNDEIDEIIQEFVEKELSR